MTAAIESASALVASWGLSIVLQAPVTLPMTLLAVRLARRCRAAVRHLWLTAGIVGACDDVVVGRVDGTVYADQLVTLASRMTPALSHPLLAIASRSHLACRVAALLDEQQTRGRAGRTTRTAIVLVMAALIMAVSSLELVRAAQEFELDAVSVREGGSGLQFGFHPGRMMWTNVSLETLVGYAFGVLAPARDMQIEGWPDQSPRHAPAEIGRIAAKAAPAMTAVQSTLVQDRLNSSSPDCSWD